MTPTIGRVVIYKTTEADRQEFKDRACNVMHELPAEIVAVWGTQCINVKVKVDGPIADLWKTSIMEGEYEGNWHWPVITKV